MAEITQVGIMSAGHGSRVAELYSPQQPEKGLLLMAEPDLTVPNDRGVRSLDLIIGNQLIGLPELERITILVNPNSAIPDYYGDELQAEQLLRRQGRSGNAPNWQDRVVPIDYAVQPHDTPEHPEYGTCWGAHLLLAAMRIRDDELVLVTTGDDRLYSADGRSPITDLAASIRSNEAGATSAMLVAQLDAAYGAVRSEKLGSEHYLIDIIEAIKKGQSLQIPGRTVAIDKNVSTYATDHEMRGRIHEVATTQPPVENEGERRITDAITAEAEARQKLGRRILVERADPDAYDYDDIGNIPGVQRTIQKSRGLRDARKPIWDHRRVA